MKEKFRCNQQETFIRFDETPPLPRRSLTCYPEPDRAQNVRRVSVYTMKQRISYL